MDTSQPDRQRQQDPITRQLLELLYRTRKQKGWTVRELAEKAGISPSYVSLIENGHKVPDVDTIRDLGRVLGLDEKLLSAWVTVRGRTTDTSKAVDAAYELMQQLNIDQLAPLHTSYSLREPEPSLFRLSETAALTPMPESDLFVVGIPIFDEGSAPNVGKSAAREQRPFWIDKRMLPERDELRGAWAWRLSLKGTGPGRGLYRRGSTVVMSPDAWSPDRMHPRMVFAVRVRDEVVLSRVSWTGRQLVLLPTNDASASVLEAGSEEELRKAIMGRVILVVERYR